MTSPAERLRTAAQLMRERAEAPIAETPWTATGRFVYHAGGNPVAEAMGPRNAVHIASWHPDVALAVADLLEALAATAATAETLGFGGQNGMHVREALPVADAYLGGE